MPARASQREDGDLRFITMSLASGMLNACGSTVERVWFYNRIVSMREESRYGNMLKAHTDLAWGHWESSTEVKTNTVDAWSSGSPQARNTRPACTMPCDTLLLGKAPQAGNVEVFLCAPRRESSAVNDILMVECVE